MTRLPLRRLLHFRRAIWLEPASVVRAWKLAMVGELITMEKERINL